jgi:tRNA pseudouridine38-40 synthase
MTRAAGSPVTVGPPFSRPVEGTRAAERTEVTISAPATTDDSLVRLRLDISYDGTGFSGWAAQPDRRTVAGCLLQALEVLFRQAVPLVVAGRTDAGVHAIGQVAHIDVDSAALAALAPRLRHYLDGDPENGGRRGLLRRLAGLLPPDIRVRRVTSAPPGFDARFSALRRHYRYRIGTAEWGVDPLQRFDVLARRRPLDVDAMSRAAAALIGLHDFAAFCKPREGATTIRELQDLTVSGNGDDVVVEVRADAFCHSMVRALVGSLIAVGEHQVPIGRPAELLAGRSRASGLHIAPALGLTLVGVEYPPDDQLAERAASTRSVRQLPSA